MIAISLSPNTQKDDVSLAFKTLLKPWNWKKGSSIGKVEEWFKKYLNTEIVFSFNSGRSAMFVLLKAFNIGKGDEVIIQSFTCLAVPEVILWAGATPKYVDIDNTLNINPKLLEQAINSKTKAIIVQHTFGVPAQMDMITKITQKYGIILIEDCAHALGATYKGQKIGTFGDASFFSFGRDKVISSVFGGLASINSSKFSGPKQTLSILADNLDYPSYFWIFQQILHPIMFFFILPTYNLTIGKIILVFLQKIKLLSFPILKEEKEGKKPNIFPQLYPNALAVLVLNQLKKLEKLNNHRQKIASLYFDRFSKEKNITLPAKIEGAIYLRFNVLADSAQKLRFKAKKLGILLGNWYHCVIDPEGSSSIAKYKLGINKFSEKVAQESINLPTNINTNEKDVEKVVSVFK